MPPFVLLKRKKKNPVKGLKGGHEKKLKFDALPPSGQPFEEFKRQMVQEFGRGEFIIFDNDPKKKGPERRVWSGTL